jgi:hypothetical protein
MIPIRKLHQSQLAMMQASPFLDSVTFETNRVPLTKTPLSSLPFKILRLESAPIGFQKLERTLSEVELYEEEILADQRDKAMFQRIVSGIHRTQSQTQDCRWRHANDVSLQNLYKTRNEETCSIESIRRSRI